MSGINNKKIMNALENSKAKITMFADGFVDEVWEIISSRASSKDFSIYTQMTQFSERIQSSGTGGVGLELVRKRRSFGGFTPNTGYALARLGVDTTLVGVYGKEHIDPVFEEIGRLCHLFSLGDPAVTHIFEFDDGKIMLSHMEAVQDINWQRIVETLGMGKMDSLLAQSDIIGVGYWSLLPAFDEIVAGACEAFPEDNKTRRFFFDFADFRKKDVDSLNDTLQKLKTLNEKYPMTLSVNEHEAAALFGMYDETLDDKGRPIQEKIEYIRQRIALDEFVVHTPYYAAAASSKENPAFAASVFCERPVRTAGAGDTFNGGYLAASLAGLDITERLQVGNAAVGFFLRNSTPPEIKHLAQYINE